MQTAHKAAYAVMALLLLLVGSACVLENERVRPLMEARLPSYAAQEPASGKAHALPEKWKHPSSLRFLLLQRDLRQLLTGYMLVHGAWPSTLDELWADFPLLFLPVDRFGEPYAIVRADGGEENTYPPGSVLIHLDAERCIVQVFHRSGDGRPDMQRSHSAVGSIRRADVEQTIAMLQPVLPAGGVATVAERLVPAPSWTLHGARKQIYLKLWQERLRLFIQAEGRLPSELMDMTQVFRSAPAQDMLVSPATTEQLLREPAAILVTLDHPGTKARLWLSPHFGQPPAMYEHHWVLDHEGSVSETRLRQVLAQEDSLFLPFALLRLPITGRHSEAAVDANRPGLSTEPLSRD